MKMKKIYIKLHERKKIFKPNYTFWVCGLSR